jgi:hydrogenase expression/formation protein HypC
MTSPAADHVRKTAPECLDEVCVTCSDTAVVSTVVSLLDGALAIVDTGCGREEVSVALVDASPGDRILVHAKEAIAVLRGDQDDAAG